MEIVGGKVGGGLEEKIICMANITSNFTIYMHTVSMRVLALINGPVTSSTLLVFRPSSPFIHHHRRVAYNQWQSYQSN